jgi:hypothetical protein
LVLTIGKFDLSDSVIAAVKVAAHFANTPASLAQPEAIYSCAISIFPQATLGEESDTNNKRTETTTTPLD